MNKNTKNIIIIVLIILLAVAIYSLSKRNNTPPIDNPENGNGEIVNPEDNNGKDPNKPIDNSKPNENTNNNPEQVITQGEIKELDIEIDFPNKDNDIDIEYEVKANMIEAKVDDEINKNYLTGEKAKTYIEDNFLTINYNNPESEVVDKILEVLNINEEFSELKVEVEYNDGTVNKIKIIQ